MEWRRSGKTGQPVWRARLRPAQQTRRGSPSKGDELPRRSAPSTSQQPAGGRQGGSTASRPDPPARHPRGNAEAPQPAPIPSSPQGERQGRRPEGTADRRVHKIGRRAGPNHVSPSIPEAMPHHSDLVPSSNPQGGSRGGETHWADQIEEYCGLARVGSEPQASQWAARACGARTRSRIPWPGGLGAISPSLVRSAQPGHALGRGTGVREREVAAQPNYRARPGRRDRPPTQDQDLANPTRHPINPNQIRGVGAGG